jgi:hypothetical protein
MVAPIRQKCVYVGLRAHVNRVAAGCEDLPVFHARFLSPDAPAPVRASRTEALDVGVFFDQPLLLLLTLPLLILSLLLIAELSRAPLGL